jgi:hypothetical protein
MVAAGITRPSTVTAAQNATAGQRQRPSEITRGGRRGAWLMALRRDLTRHSIQATANVTDTSIRASSAASDRSNDERYWM